jgi:hypothetical protein
MSILYSLSEKMPADIILTNFNYNLKDRCRVVLGKYLIASLRESELINEDMEHAGPRHSA